MNTAKTTYFIADIHLTSVNQKAIAKFIDFLASISSKKVERLFILGDLFTVWSGDDDNSVLAQKIKKGLKKLSDSGVQIFLLRGNRDFLLGEKFAKESGITLLEDQHIFDLYGRKTMLTHGDSLCINDVSHQKLHNFLQHPKLKEIFLKLPLWIRNSLAWTVHGLCAIIPSVSRKDITNMVYNASVKLAKQHDLTQIIHGHLHREEIDEFILGEQTIRRICVGDWLKDKSSVLVYKQDGKCEFVRD